MDDRQILCTVLTPYIEFKDGTRGCILVLYRQKGIPSVFLFNSPHRQGNNHSANQKFLFQYEYDLLVRYINGVEKHGYPHNKELKDTYNDYGVARLCTNFIGICLKDMISRTENGHMPRIQLSQLSHMEGVKERLASAKMQYTTYELEDELLFYADDTTLWERSILEQAMLQLSPPVNPQEWFESSLKTIRTTFVGSIQNVTSISFGVDFGYRLATAYAKDTDVKWWRILERTVSMKYPEEGINYSNFGFQEIVAFYGLTQYIAAQQPFGHLTLDVGRVPLTKRIELYDAYKNNIEKECLDVLRNEDNPLLSAMPTKQDAQKAAKERLKENLGKAPDWLPEEWRPVYSQYEQAFCKDIVEEKLNATVHKGFEAYIVKDHKKVMGILMFVAHLGNGQMPLMIKVIRALQNLNYIRQDCFEDFQLFIKNAEEQFSNINFDKANVRHNVEKGNNTLDKKYKDSVENIAKYLTSLL